MTGMVSVVIRELPCWPTIRQPTGLAHWRFRAFWPTVRVGAEDRSIMLRKSIFAAAVMVVANGGSARAQTAYGSDGPLGVALDSFFRRLDVTLGNIPGLLTYLKGLPTLFDFRITVLLVGIVVAGLAAELFARMVLQPTRVRVFERHAGESPLRAF